MSRDQPIYRRYTVCATSLHFTVNEHIKRFVLDISLFDPTFPSEGKIKVCTFQIFVEVTHISSRISSGQCRSTYQMKATQLITQFTSCNQFYVSSFSSAYVSSIPKRQFSRTYRRIKRAATAVRAVMATTLYKHSRRLVQEPHVQISAEAPPTLTLAPEKSLAFDRPGITISFMAMISRRGEHRWHTFRLRSPLVIVAQLGRDLATQCPIDLPTLH